jgi:phage tail sheath protein FI
VVSGINAKLQALVTAGKLIGAACWFDIVDNPTTGIRQEKPSCATTTARYHRWKI